MSNPIRTRAGHAGIVVLTLAVGLTGALATAPLAAEATSRARTQQQEEAAASRADLERQIARLSEALAELNARQQEQAGELEERLEQALVRLSEEIAALRGQGSPTGAEQRRLEESMARAARQLEVARENQARRMNEAVAEIERRSRAAQERQVRQLEERMAVMNEQAAELRARATQQVEEARLHGREVAERAREMAARAADQARASVVRGRSRPLGSYAFVGCEDLAEEILDDAEDLGLSEEQADGVRDLRRQHRRDSIERQADLEIAEMDLEDLRRADPMDLTAIEAKLREIADMQIQASMASLRVRQGVLELLTPEQRDQVEEAGASRNVTVVTVGQGVGRLERIGC